MPVTQLRPLGGAMARVPVDATAFAHRKSKIMANLAALYEKPEEAETHEAWVSDYTKRMQQSDHGVYVNFVGVEGGVHNAYPAKTWERLAAIKARYDPTNLFRHNHNIPPS